MTWRHHAVGLGLVIGLLPGVAFGGPTVSTVAWIDAPLEWIVVTDTPVHVVAHVADSGGVIAARLVVDSATIATENGGGETLEVFDFEWEPTEGGVYLLEVYGRGPSGTWSPPATATVTVVLSADPTTTTTTTTTPTSSTTVGVTTTCAFGTPSGTSPTGEVGDTTPTLRWSYTGCQPEEFQVEIARETTFTRTEAAGSIDGAERAWTVPAPLEECVLFYWRVRTYDAGVTGPWSAIRSFTVVGPDGCA